MTTRRDWAAAADADGDGTADEDGDGVAVLPVVGPQAARTTPIRHATTILAVGTAFIAFSSAPS
jgi:hypothetical protein